MFEEGKPLAGGSWGPYKLFYADLWECKGCGAEVIFGMGQNPIAEHYQKDYAAKVEQHRPLFRVDAC